MINLTEKGNITDDGTVVEDSRFADTTIIKVIDRLGINVTINTMDERNVRLVVRNSDKIINVVKKIKERIRFNEEEHSLECRGQILGYGYDKTVTSYGITEGSVITVMTKLRDSMVIFAKTMDGKTHELSVSKNNTIADIKKKIHDKIGLAPEVQRLEYQEGTLWDDYKTIEEYPIVEKSVIDVCVISPWMNLWAKTMDGNCVGFLVIQKDTIIDIKNTIHWLFRLAPEIQILKYEGMVLQDNRTIEYYGITADSVVDVRLKGGIQIFVEAMDGGRVIFEVTKNDRIIDIKRKIYRKARLAPDEQRLIFQGQILDDDRTIEEYHINDYSVIKVIDKSSRIINVRTVDDKIYVIVLIDNCTVPDLKKKIGEELNLSPDEQILRYQGVILSDDKTINYYNIIDDCTVDVVIDYKPIQISIRSIQGDTFLLTVKNNDTINDIKKMIQEKIGQSSDNQILKFGGEIIIDDSWTVYQCKITDNSNIEVSSRIIITILSHTMETVRLEISNSDTIIDVKKKIQGKIGLPYDEQILEFKNTILSEDDKTVYDYNIGGDSDVTVSGWPTRTRGICLVISNETFTELDTRDGTRIDEANIKETFEDINYEVKIRRNVRYIKMDNVINETKAAVKDSHQMLIVFILSHGKEEGVITVDGAVIPFSTICTPFSNENFAKLSGKPKLFFFVCCQGSNLNIAVSVASGSHMDHDGPLSMTDVCPAMADFFIGYATCESYVALRTVERGTHYVDCICQVVRDNPRWSIGDIHQEVQSRLSQVVVEGTHIQMPHCDNRLRKYAYLCD